MVLGYINNIGLPIIGKHICTIISFHTNGLLQQLLRFTMFTTGILHIAL